MIDNLNGMVEKKSEGSLILSVNGIGYKLYVSDNCLNNLPAVGEKVKILVFLYVRENILDLYAFKDHNERESFFLLISVNGIGPKLALLILSKLDFIELKKHIISGSLSSLTAIPGVGLKTAKRIVIELKEKFISINDDSLGIDDKIHKNSPLYENVSNALVSLGFKKHQANSACEKLIKKNDFNGSLEQIIKKALKYLMN